MALKDHIDYSHRSESRPCFHERGKRQRLCDLSSLTYEVMWGDAIVIEVDEHFQEPRFQFQILRYSTMSTTTMTTVMTTQKRCSHAMVILIPWDWVNDGHEDCEDGSDEYDDDGIDPDNESGMDAQRLKTYLRIGYRRLCRLRGRFHE